MKAMIAAALIIPVERVILLSVTPGSLIVDFQISNAVNRQSDVLSTALATMMVAKVDTSTLQAVYVSTTGDTTSITVTSVVARTSVTSNDDSNCGPGCIGVVVAVVVVVVAVVVGLIALVFANIVRKREDKPARRKAPIYGSEEEEAQQEEGDSDLYDEEPVYDDPSQQQRNDSEMRSPVSFQPHERSLRYE